MFDRDGNRTPVYDYVKTAGIQIEAVDEVLMCCKSKGVIVSGSMPWDGNSGIPAKDILQTYGEISAVNGWHTLVGCFDYNGKTALYVTNNSVTEGDDVDITFTKGVKGYTVQKAVKNQFEGAELNLKLDAGEGVLVVIE